MIGSEEFADDSTSTAASTEPEMSATDVDDEDDLSSTVLLDPPSPPKYRPTSTGDVFSMDDFDSAAENGDAESSDADTAPAPGTHFSIDLEIASVFKPRPVRIKAGAHVSLPAKNKRGPKIKKGQHLPDSLSPSTSPADQAGFAVPFVKPTKAQNRRQARDRKREERRQALMMYATAALEPAPQLLPDTDTDAACAVADATNDDSALVSGLEALHVSVEPVRVAVAIVSEPTIPSLELNAVDDDDDGEDDVFPSPLTATPVPLAGFSSQLTVPVQESSARGREGAGVPRLIVEALVVRKMSLEEAFLDFGGFSPHS